MSLAQRLPGLTIAELSVSPAPLDGGESVEITTATRADGGGGVVEKTYRLSLTNLLNLYAARKNNPNSVTAEQVGAYTTAQVDTLLQGKLASGGTAVNSERLGGSTGTQIIDQARSGLLLVLQYENDLEQITSALDNGSTIINTP